MREIPETAEYAEEILKNRKSFEGLSDRVVVDMHLVIIKCHENFNEKLLSALALSRMDKKLVSQKLAEFKAKNPQLSEDVMELLATIHKQIDC